MSASPVTVPETITLRSPQDLLASIPYQLGFRPTESVVLACVSARRTLDLVARVDIDDLGPDVDDLNPGDGAVVLDGLTRAVHQADPAWCALVVYTARDEDEVAAAAAAVRSVVGAAVDLDEWIVSPTGYRGLGCVDDTCCPAGGYPLDALEASPAGAEHVLAGRYVADSAEAAFRIRTADRAARGLAARAARRSENALDRAHDDGWRWRAEALGVWRSALRQAAAGPDDGAVPATLGRVAAALADRRVRDAALLTLVPGGDRAADRTIDPAASSDAATARVLAGVTDVGEPVRPDEARLRLATRVLEDVVAHGPRRLAPPALTLLAFAAWWQGDGPRASHRIAEVLEIDPGYRLALLLGGVLAAGLPPGWIRARSQGLPPTTIPSGREVR
jgi:hypothetical protein